MQLGLRHKQVTGDFILASSASVLDKQGDIFLHGGLLANMRLAFHLDGQALTADLNCPASWTFGVDSRSAFWVSFASELVRQALPTNTAGGAGALGCSTFSSNCCWEIKILIVRLWGQLSVRIITIHFNIQESESTCGTHNLGKSFNL